MPGTFEVVNNVFSHLYLDLDFFKWSSKFYSDSCPNLSSYPIALEVGRRKAEAMLILFSYTMKKSAKALGYRPSTAWKSSQPISEKKQL
jgi:hypothetical protein